MLRLRSEHSWAVRKRTCGDSNGDDNIAIIDGSSDIIDLFGVSGEDGSNTCHEFEDGVALRAGTNTDPNGGAWDEVGLDCVQRRLECERMHRPQLEAKPQNAADIAPLVGNWAGAGEAPAAPPTDFNDGRTSAFN